jgi:hypothetical protein
LGAVMMQQDQSSPATVHRFGCIIALSTLAPLKGEGGEGRVNPESFPWVHRFHKRYQCFSQRVKAVNPKQVKTLQGDKDALAVRAWGMAGRLRVSRTYIGKLPSQGSPGSPPSPSIGDRASPLINDGSYPMGPCRGDSDPRKNPLDKNFSIMRPAL